jgi:hypothetical protein
MAINRKGASISPLRNMSKVKPSIGRKRSATSNTAGDLTPLKWPPIERRKGMEKQISRRSFLKKGAIALSTVAVCDFEGIGGAEQMSGSKTLLLSEELKERTMPHVTVKLYPGRK